MDASQQQPNIETNVKIYENAKEFQKDQNKMNKQGWNVTSVQDHQKNRSLAGKVLLPWEKPNAQMVVTYQRVVEPKAPKPSPFSSLSSAASASPILSSFKETYQQRFEEQMQKRLRKKVENLG